MHYSFSIWFGQRLYLLSTHTFYLLIPNQQLCSRLRSTPLITAYRVFQLDLFDRKSLEYIPHFGRVVGDRQEPILDAGGRCAQGQAREELGDSMSPTIHEDGTFMIDIGAKRSIREGMI